MLSCSTRWSPTGVAVPRRENRRPLPTADQILRNFEAPSHRLFYSLRLSLGRMVLVALKCILHGPMTSPLTSTSSVVLHFRFNGEALRLFCPRVMFLGQSTCGDYAYCSHRLCEVIAWTEIAGYSTFSEPRSICREFHIHLKGAFRGHYYKSALSL